MSKLDISLCMIMKDEEAHLERCLSSIQHLVSEIIIADTGSQDQSVSIAERFGARVMHLPWEHDFAKARNIVLRQASCSWILVLDADEEADHWDPDELNSLLHNPNNQGYFCPLISYVGEPSNQSYVTDTVCRLFRNDDRITFCDRIHESIAPSIWDLPDGHIEISSLRIKHYGYLEHELIGKEKGKRNLIIIQESLQQHPDHLPTLYALGTEYYQMGEYEAAAQVLVPLLDKVEIHSGYTSDLYLKSAYALQMCGHLEQSEAILLKGTILFPDFTDLLETYALLLAEQGYFSTSYEVLQKALAFGDVSIIYSSSSGSGTYRTHWIAGKLNEQMLQFDNAMGHYEQCLAFCPDYVPAWKNLVPLCLLTNQIPRLLLITEKYQASLTPDILMFLAPSALNSRSIPWLTQLIFVLPSQPSSIIEAVLFQQKGEHDIASKRLEELLISYPNHPMILSYLWAITYEAGDSHSSSRWLKELIQLKPEIAYIQQRLVNDYHDLLDPESLEYCLQVLMQTGSWSTLLTLFRHSHLTIRWSTLPQSALAGLLQAPHAVKLQWCHIFTHIQDSDAHNHTSIKVLSNEISEWLFYATLAYSCGDKPELSERIEEALRNSRETIPLVALSYYKLLSVNPFQSTSIPSGSILWPLLFRSYMDI